MTSYKLTLSISSKPPLRNPPGKPGVSEQSTNHSQAAGALLSVHYRKIVARHPHRKRLRKFQPNSFAHQLHHKKKTSSSQLLPNPGVSATNSSLAKSRTEPFPIASDNSDLHPTLDAQKRVILTSPLYSKHLMVCKLHTHGSLPGLRAQFHSMLPIFGSLDK